MPRSRHPTPAPGSLDARLAAALERLAVADRALRQAQVTPVGLSPIQLQILTALRDLPPLRRRVTALARELGVTQPTVSDAVASLVAKGLVRREPVTGDRRGGALLLTPAGRKVLADTTALEQVLAGTLAGLDDEAKATTLAVLLACIAALVADGVITVARCCTTCRHFRRRPGGPMHCALLDRPLPPSELRVDCPEHEAAPLSPSVTGP
jgi:DNA-binding MarR family transcriptional regulator